MSVPDPAAVAVQRRHDLAKLHAALLAAQNRAELCDWPEMSRALRRHREEAAARLLSAGGESAEFHP